MMHEDKEFSDFDDDLGHSHTTYHGHDHSHSHGHDGSCSHESHRATSSWKNGASEDSHDHDHDHENGEEEKIKFDDVVNVVQFGAKVHLITLLQQYRDLVHQRDSKGNTLMHWAAKRGSVDILQAIFELGGKIDIASTAEPNMLPIHWAAADGKIDAIAFLLSKGQDINAQDTNGSSPAVIAAQYGQVNTIIYLYKHSADLTLSDHSGDHVLHWAAYKGNDEILQLMLYLYPREVNISDRFGQTALHLGALRGYANIVETLLKKYQADYTLRDKSGNTPLELSIEKKQNHIEFLIKRLTIKSTFELYRKAFSEDRKFLMPTLFGADDYEKCVWQWRLTFYSNLYATICLLQLTFSELLSDLFYLHTVNIIIVLFWWVFFFGCLWKDPGYITGNPYKNAKNTSNNGNNGVNHKKYPFEQGDIEEARECLLPSDQENSLYEKGLDIIGRVESSHYNPVLCHTCHVERPLRSKHDRFTNKCVHKFDHFCPFVYNAIGRDNYRFFIGLLLLHPIAYTGFVIENIYYYMRTPDPISYLYYAFFVYSIAMCVMVMTLGFYHLRLIEYNLTTNEFSNQKKYEYLQDELTQQYHNPFNMNRSVWLNCMDVCVPSQKVYYTRNDAIRGELRPDSVMSERNV